MPAKSASKPVATPKAHSHAPSQGQTPEEGKPSAIYQDASRRLARINGQVAGLQKMVDEGRYCVDILTQVSAIRAALDQLGLLMLTTHIEGCVYGEQEDGQHADYSTKEERVAELRTTLNRFLK